MRVPSTMSTMYAALATERRDQSGRGGKNQGVLCSNVHAFERRSLKVLGGS